MPRAGLPRAGSRTPWLAAAVAAAVLVVYAASLRYPLVFDDEKLTADLLRGYAHSSFRLDLRWFPYATLGWTYALFGAERFWMHLGNVLLHAAASALLFVFLRRLFGALAEGTPPIDTRRDPRRIAFFASLVFALHPVAVYGVAYLTQRSILMATLFSVLALLCLLEGLLRGSRAWLAGSVAAYFLAVFSKEHAVALPGVAAALAVLCCRGSWATLRRLAWVFACYSAVALFVTLKQKGVLGMAYEPFASVLVHQIAAPQGMPGPATAAAGSAVGAAPSAGALYLMSVENQALLFFRYLGTWLVPYPGWMSIDVGAGFPSSATRPAYVAALAAWLAFPVLAGALMMRAGRRALAGFGLLAAWILSLPEFSTIRVQEPFVLYRSYLWMSLLPAALPALVQRVPARWLAWLLGGLVIALLPSTLDRVHSFSSSYRLWDDAARKNGDFSGPMAWRAYRNRGVALYNEGRYEPALRDFDRAIALDPHNSQAWLTRAVLFNRIGSAQRALSDLEHSLALEPGNAEALGQRCLALGLLRQLPEALAACRAARDANPSDPMAHVKLGVVETLLGNAGGAEQEYQRALQISPGERGAHYQYGMLLQATSRAEQARAHFAAACRAGLGQACEASRRLLSGRLQ